MRWRGNDGMWAGEGGKMSRRAGGYSKNSWKEERGAMLCHCVIRSVVCRTLQILQTVCHGCVQSGMQYRMQPIMPQLPCFLSHQASMLYCVARVRCEMFRLGLVLGRSCLSGCGLTLATNLSSRHSCLQANTNQPSQILTQVMMPAMTMRTWGECVVRRTVSTARCVVQ